MNKVQKVQKKINIQKNEEHQNSFNITQQLPNSIKFDSQKSDNQRQNSGLLLRKRLKDFEGGLKVIDLKKSNNELITQELSQIENIQSLIDTTQSLEPKLWLQDQKPK